MTNHNPVLNSEIRYCDHISWPRFWISTVFWSIILYVFFVAFVIQLAVKINWSPWILMSIAYFGLLAIFVIVGMTRVFRTRFCTYLSAHELRVTRGYFSVRFPLDHLQMRFGNLNEDHALSWAKPRPCLMIFHEGKRRASSYVLSLQHDSHEESQARQRSRIFRQASIVFVFVTLLIWLVCHLCFRLSPPYQENLGSFVLASFLAGLLIAYHVACLAWLGWLKDKDLLDSHDIEFTKHPTSEIGKNFIAAALFFGAHIDVTFTTPMALFTILVHLVTFIYSRVIADSATAQIAARAAKRRQLARDTIRHWMENQKKTNSTQEVVLA